MFVVVVVVDDDDDDDGDGDGDGDGDDDDAYATLSSLLQEWQQKAADANRQAWCF